MAKRRRKKKEPAPDFLPKPKKVDTFQAKYQPDFVRQVYYLALLGAKDSEIANVLGVTTGAVNKWKQTKPEFLTALLKGKERADSKVAYSLFKRAVGYKHKKTHVLTNRVKKRNHKGKVIQEYTEPLLVDIEEDIIPDVTAAIKWLQMRQPELWTNKMKLEGTVQHEHNINLKDFSTEELKVLAKLGVQADGQIQDTEYEEME